MSNGATKNYKFGPKNNWRRTLWNEVLRRTNGREQTELILYLAGPQDLDRAVAISKGVPAHNLIAIDRCPDNVYRIRRSKDYAICGDVLDVLRAWPSNRQVCALVLDFCSGLLGNDWTGELANVTFLRESLRYSVLALNFLRGRDGHSEVIRRLSVNFMKAMRPHSGWTKLMKLDDVDDKHRGYAFACWQASLFAKDVDAMLCNIIHLQPKLLSYRSGHLVFDSVVLNPIANGFIFTGTDNAAEIAHDMYPARQAAVRSIAATMAIRTSRLNIYGRAGTT